MSSRQIVLTSYGTLTSEWADSVGPSGGEMPRVRAGARFKVRMGFEGGA